MEERAPLRVRELETETGLLDSFDDDAVMSESSIPRQSDFAGVGLGAGADDAAACADDARLLAASEARAEAEAAAAVRAVEAAISCW